MLRLSGLVEDSIVDGPGLRLSVFTQGCPHRCPDCHNPESQDPAGGYDMLVAEIVQRARKNPLLTGVTLTGGEPMEQARACLALVKALPEELTVWVYSGYLYEEIMADAERAALLEACDVLVDGRFQREKKSLELSFRGSANQQVIDIKKTRANGGKVVEWIAPVW